MVDWFIIWARFLKTGLIPNPGTMGPIIRHIGHQEFIKRDSMGRIFVAFQLITLTVLIPTTHPIQWLANDSKGF
jgi:hypothetical protein